MTLVGIRDSRNLVYSGIPCRQNGCSQKYLQFGRLTLGHDIDLLQLSGHRYDAAGEADIVDIDVAYTDVVQICRTFVFAEQAAASLHYDCIGYQVPVVGAVVTAAAAVDIDVVGGIAADSSADNFVDAVDDIADDGENAVAV